LPVESNFIKFWENTITTHNPDSELIFDNELEVDELNSLFKSWSKQNSDKLMSSGNITEESMLKILKHFFPSVEIVEDKFVLSVTCSMWNKSNDISDSFDYIKEQIKLDHKLALISFDDAYNFYNKYACANSLKFVVSKRFFEKYLYYKFADHIVYDKFIETDWFTSS
jgi:phage/plasmid-associated DNA primase